MCNAWNHPPECSCGWGGEGHLGKRATGSSGNNHSSFTGNFSYTNPNARCPVCGTSVFFYQSPEGGRVYFDELGPPWPKHPCTSNPSVQFGKAFRPSDSIFSGPVRTYTWQTNGWVPFNVDSIQPQPPTFKAINIMGSMNGENLSLYSNLKGLTVKAPFLIKKLGDGLYEISTVQSPKFSKGAPEKVFFKACTLSYCGYKELLESSHQKRFSSNGVRTSPSRISNTRKLSEGKNNKRQKPTEGALQQALLDAGLAKK